MIDIELNKNRFIELINSITRMNFRKDEFLNMLENSDFYTCPASTHYHNDIPGGLCDHCLKVYDNLVNLCNIKGYMPKDPESIIIAALFHDLGKINLYTIGHRNVKHYCTKEEFEADPKGYKASDEAGNYKWVAEDYYMLVDADKRLLYGNHEATCEYIARSYIPLRMEESVAILHHMGGLSFDSAKDDTFELYRRFPLAMFLFESDLMASIIDEVVI